MSGGRSKATIILVIVLGAACSSTSLPRSATTSATSTSRPRTSFCDLYRQDANDGHLRNWNLTENGKTASYVVTLRGLADAATAALKPDVERILAYYAAPNPQPSPAEYLAGLRSGERVLEYVQRSCGIDTNASPPPGDSSTTTP